MSHAAPGRLSRRRRRRDEIDDRDAETIAIFERINRPTRIARERARQFVNAVVAATLTETKSIKAAQRMTEMIRRYAKAGAK